MTTRNRSHASKPDAYTRAAIESHNARGIPAQATRAIAAVNNSPEPAIDTEINAEMIGLSVANKDLSSLITLLTDRLEPILTPEHTQDDRSAQAAPVSMLGHRLREETTAVRVSIERIQRLINRLAI